MIPQILKKFKSWQHSFIILDTPLKIQKKRFIQKELQKLLGSDRNSPEEDLMSRLTLRSLKQAKYTVECSGHFGLAAKYYCHFTSPIRRYPDCSQIHNCVIEKKKISEEN